jgi:predicted CXXCH cytochrome family protein
MLAVPAAFAQMDEGCSTKDCHPDIGAGEWVHGPVGVGACTVCHTAIEGEDHKFAFPAEREELCFACHEDSRDYMMKSVLHTPVAEGNCTGCHDPHSTAYRFSLKGEAKALCFNCHDQTMFEGESVHGPVAVGDCNACHDPHASEFVNQLLDDPIAICFTCHDDRRDMMEMRHLHPPVEESCLSCHAAHASASRMLLPDKAPDLCYGCHEDIETYAASSNPHAPVASGQCDQCHDPHGSNHPKLFPRPAKDLCFECHSELSEYVQAQAHHHGPLGEGDCNACHDPHGSEHHMILREDFPEDFYTPYAEEKYAICFKCHNHQIAMEEHTETLTDFRDGDLNLHYLHVNKDEKGRTCRACHQVHASSQEKHIRLSVPYGSIAWELPVTFTKTEDGGTCQVGCHAPKGYKR